MHPLTFMTSAIAGAPLEIRVLDQQEASYTDGQVVCLSNQLDETQQRDAALFQALLLRTDSLSREIVTKLIGRPAAAKKYLVLEIYRGLLQLRSELPGQLLRNYAVPPEVPRTQSAEQSLALALSRQPVPEPLRLFGRLRPYRLRKAQGAVEGSMLSKKEMRGEFSVDQLDQHDEDTEAEGSSLLGLFINPLSDGNNALSRMLNKILGAGTSGGAGDDKDEGYGSVPMERAVQTSLANAGAAQQMPGDSAPLPAVFESVVAEFQYPEWDEEAQAYRHNHTLVSEYEPWEDVEDVQALGVDHTHLLTRQMSAVGVEYETLSHQPSGEDFGLDAAVNYAVDLATGHSPDEFIYRMSHKTKRDLSTFMLLDISGSTRDVNQKGISIHQQQAGFIEALARAMHRLGDQVAIYGFHSQGKRLVRFMRLKTFAERYGSQVNRRIEQLKPAGYSRLGAAIRHGCYLINRQRLTHHRLLLFVSDGFAYDDGYEDRYAEADTVKALEEAKAQGIACACISIGSEKSDQALARTFGSAAYLRCATLDHLPLRLRKHLQSAIACAAKH
jgi:Mg-chelatase subunit ChlD